MCAQYLDGERAVRCDVYRKFDHNHMPANQHFGRAQSGLVMQPFGSSGKGVSVLQGSRNDTSRAVLKEFLQTLLAFRE